MPNYNYEVDRFTKAERQVLAALIQRGHWKKTTYCGSQSSGNQCILKSPRLINNPFHRKKGPLKLTPYQVQFIVVRGYLPKQDMSVPKNDRYELSHICGNRKCINISGRHIWVELHSKNVHRIDHHNQLVDRRNTEMRKRRLRRRNTGSKRGCSVISTLKATKADCDCYPRCFKNF